MTMPGPAYWAAAVPVNTKMPAPTIEAMPISSRLVRPSCCLRRGRPEQSPSSPDPICLRVQMPNALPSDADDLQSR